jgi:hypothetical protein
MYLAMTRELSESPLAKAIVWTVVLAITVNGAVYTREEVLGTDPSSV